MKARIKKRKSSQEYLTSSVRLRDRNQRVQGNHTGAAEVMRAFQTHLQTFRQRRVHRSAVRAGSGARMSTDSSTVRGSSRTGL